MENARTVICTKCGAQLEPDQDYNIYRCNFCGVAFGSSILFNKDAMEKADKSLQLGEYNEADVWYRCVLMREPKNFMAFRGRILCAGKWKSVTEIDTEVMSEVRIKKLYKRIEEAMGHSDDEDMDYFASFRKVVSVIERYCQNENEINPLNARLAKLSEQRKQFYIQQEEAEREAEEQPVRVITEIYGETAVKNSVKEVEQKLQPLLEQRKYLDHEFRVARQFLIGVEKKKGIDTTQKK